MGYYREINFELNFKLSNFSVELIFVLNTLLHTFKKFSEKLRVLYYVINISSVLSMDE